jgi:steroid 5-alpha reductase family enzyme
MSGFSWTTFGWASLAALGGIVVVIAVTFATALRLDRHNVIDTAWGPGFLVALLAADAVALGSAQHDGSGRRLLITVLTAAWALRLAIHMGIRGRGEGEDPRYVAMLADAPGNRNLYALRKVYLIQGLAMWFVSLPLQVTAVGGGSIGVLGWIGFAVWIVGFVFEAGGDWQLSAFRKNDANKGLVMDRGLWRYTRHPNYFGDACQWWGFALIAFAHWPGITTIASPALMTWFLARKTGKPLLESRMATTRPGYAQYIARTSGFFPLPPRTPLPPQPGTAT